MNKRVLALSSSLQKMVIPTFCATSLLMTVTQQAFVIMLCFFVLARDLLLINVSSNNEYE